MKLRYGLLALAFLLLTSFPAQATKVNKADLEATHILMGKVESVESFYGVNERGDQIILSHVKVKALKWIKGDHSSAVDFLVEGGSVGDMALKVSDIPEFEKGQRLRLLLKKENGEFKYEDSEIEETTRFKPAKAAAGCCKTYAAWPQLPVNYLVNTANADCPPLPDLDAAATAWNRTVDVLHDAGSTGKAVAAYDGENVIFFNKTSSGGAIAVTYLWYNKRARVMLEFDMYFFESAWQFYSLTRGDDCLDGFYYKTIATHELGHAVGIDHNRCVDSIMYPYASYCGINGLTPADKACLTALYQ